MVGLFGDDDPPATPQAYRVLARKYRPRDFNDLIGQEALVRTLRNGFAQNRVAHAFMLTGVRGVGKTTTARILARALNCIGADGTGGATADPCGVCANCVAILADRHPDVVEMDAASNTGVDHVREIIEAARFRPLSARTKLFIVDEVHMLSRNAFNALLKTLEEPPAHVKFVFATTEIRKVPITVLSRCQRFDLRRVSTETLAAHFATIAAAEGVTVAEAALQLIARAADGSVRDGLSLLDQAIALGAGAAIEADAVAEMLGLADRGLVFDLLDAVMAGDAKAALAITDQVHAGGGDAGALLGDLLDLVHTVTRIKSVPALARAASLPEAERVRGGALAQTASVPVLARAWQMLLKGLGEVEGAPDRRGAAEMVLIRLCHVADLPTPGELVKQLAERPPAGVGVPPTAAVAPPPEGAMRAAMGGGVAPHAAPIPLPEAPLAPLLGSFRDVVALAASAREPMLHAHLVHSAHLVRFAPCVIELRLEPDAPRDFAPKLGALLLAATGQRWTLALSTAPGAPTLAAQAAAADAARRDAAGAHPLVRAILEAFPGAAVQAVIDARIDDYGLEVAPSLGEPDMPEFAPADAEFASLFED